MYFIGCTRFSLYMPGSNAWYISKVAEESYLSQLYSDERMTARFDIFFNKAAPLYEGMAKKFFYKHVVQYSSVMPEKWKDRLFEEASKYDFIILNEASTKNISITIKEILADQPSGSLAYFRVDDDDVLSSDYLSLLENYTNKNYEGMIVSFGCGLIATYVDGAFRDFRTCYRRFLALGLAFVGGYDADSGDYWLPRYDGHETVDRHSPTIVDSREPVFIWTHHEYQDTKVRSVGAAGAVSSRLKGYSRITSIKGYEQRFPTFKHEMEFLLENNEEILFLEKSRVVTDRVSFSTLKHKAADKFVLEYSILDESFVPGFEKGVVNNRYLIISFDFSDSHGNVEVIGLNKSSNASVGWYFYVSFVDGLANGKIEFSLSGKSELKSLRVIKWKAKNSVFKINSIRLATEGGD
ncbi:glycosyltransferase [Alcaligenes faecalis]|uniref:glycosyltransferase n=1 Tax=Alcaligenes faecalis TaxID=511 RepID=UPI0022B1050D|nr:glycosyltransferase [Alcaligenes faecalis]